MTGLADQFWQKESALRYKESVIPEGGGEGGTPL